MRSGGNQRFEFLIGWEAPRRFLGEAKRPIDGDLEDPAAALDELDVGA